MNFSAIPGFARTVALPFAFLATAATAGAPITLTDANDKDHPKTYTGGPYFVPTSQEGCITTVAPCDDTTLTIDVSPQVATTKRVVVDVSWSTVTLADFDLFITHGANNTDSSQAFAASASTTDPEVARFEPINGVYTIHVEPYQPFYNSIAVKVYLEDLPTIAPATSGSAARFQVFPPPPGLESDASGGEPSIGTNWKTGSTVVGNSSTALFVTWDDSTSPATATWASRAPFTDLVSFDPILFTDRETGLTVASQLVSDVVAFTAGCSLSSITYDDGKTWIPAEGCGPPAGADHQAVGGGPYHAPIPTVPQAPGAPVGIAQHAVYYCAQSFGGVLGDATCSRSDDGGLTYGPGVVVYTSECGGLHGHPRVSPQGTVYLPNKDCAGAVGLGQGVVISKDNGLTWTFSIVPGSTPSESDPSVATGLNGTGLPGSQSSNTVYFGYCDGDGHPKVSISRNEGTDFSQGVDVGTAASIKNCVFPEMIAGDDNRASFFFLGTPQGGGFQAADFKGEWHAYVATTYDGGATWGLFDATPADPVQIGCIWMQGGNNDCRNLLDFNDIALDAKGRPNFVFADGCLPQYDCVPGSDPSKSHKAVETIGRLAGGKTLFSQFDAVEGAKLLVPSAPARLAAAAANDITLQWVAPDDGGSPLTAYKVYRGTASGQETLLQTIAPNKAEFVDSTGVGGTRYFYKVRAVSALGDGDLSAELAVQADNVPVASLTPASATIAPGGAVDFTVGGSDADTAGQVTDPLTFDLDFGDGTAHDTTGEAAHHVYAAAGTYTARLTVTDSHRASDSKTSTITVGSGSSSGPDLAVTLTSDKAGGDVSNGAVTVTFTAHVTGGDGSVLSYTFAYGDGESSFETTPNATISHAYARAGTYYPYVTVTQNGGANSAHSGTNEDVITMTTTVTVTPAVEAHLAYSLPNGNVAPVEVTFDTSGSTGTSYTMDFGDGAVVANPGTPPASIVHRYNAPGTYTATLTTTDGTDTATQSQTFVLNNVQQLTAELQLSTSGGTAPLTVQLDGCHSVAGNGQHIVSYTMDFDDGSAPEAKAVDATHVVDCSATDRSNDPSLFSHVYTKAGTYQPILTVTDDSATPQTAQAKVLSGVKVVKAPRAAGGGGGAFGFLTLLPLFAAAGLRRRKAR